MDPDEVDDDVFEQLDGLDTLDGRGPNDPLDEGYSPPEKPWAVNDWGTTAREEAEGEDLDHRLARELPESWADEDEDDDGLGDQRTGVGCHAGVGEALLRAFAKDSSVKQIPGGDDLRPEDVECSWVELLAWGHFAAEDREAGGVTVVQDLHDLGLLVRVSEVRLIEDQGATEGIDDSEHR